MNDCEKIGMKGFRSLGTHHEFENDLDLLSNSIVDLVRENKFDAAEEKCTELLNRYPYVVDGYYRFALLCEARGDNQKAMDYYKKSADFMNLNPGYNHELVEFALNKVEHLQK